MWIFPAAGVELTVGMDCIPDDLSALVDTDRSTAACPAAATAAVISWMRLSNGLLLALGVSSVAPVTSLGVPEALGLLLAVGASSALEVSLGVPSLLGAALELELVLQLVRH